MFDPQTLKYDANGILPVIAQCAKNGEVLMLAWMNSDAVVQTLETRKVTYWSRSRKKFWIKGKPAVTRRPWWICAMIVTKIAFWQLSYKRVLPATPTGAAVFILP